MTDKIYKAVVQVEEDGSLFELDVIKFDEKLWLVPSWLEVPALGVSKPARIVRFDNRPHQSAPTRQSSKREYVLNDPVPRALLYDRSLQQQAFSFDYIDLPEIEIPASVRPIQTGQKLH